MRKLEFTRTRRSLEDIGTKIVGKVQFELGQSPVINATGKTSASIKHKLFQRESIIGVGITSRKRLGYQILEIIDKGRSTGMPPPYRAIAKWIRDKNVPIKSDKRTKRNIDRAAYGMAQAIGINQSRGSQPPGFSVRPKNVFNRAIGGYKMVAEEQLLAAIGGDLDKFIAENMPEGNKSII